MASKTATITRPERISRVGQRRQVVIPREIFEQLRMSVGDFVEITKEENTIVIKPKRVVDPDDVLTPEEGALLKKAEREMRQGKYVTLSQLNNELARKHPSRRRETA
jgi:AbrB family looped-hinge helix DNA binding protein